MTLHKCELRAKSLYRSIDHMFVKTRFFDLEMREDAMIADHREHMRRKFCAPTQNRRNAALAIEQFSQPLSSKEGTHPVSVSRNSADACALGYALIVIVFSREVFVCKCPTLERPKERHPELRFSIGKASDLGRLDRSHHNAAHLKELSERLARNEYWLLGEIDGQIVTYTWLHTLGRIEYRYLPNCVFEQSAQAGYGYDAWTPPELRSRGLRRHAFREELAVLQAMGKQWETSFFVKQQLEGATRSLEQVGIALTPLWRVLLGKDRKLSAERLCDDDLTKPLF